MLTKDADRHLIKQYRVCLISSIRLWDLVAEASRPDFTFDNVSIAYLTCSEVNGAIVVACCMTLKPFFDRVSSWRCVGRLRRLVVNQNSDSKSDGDVGDSDVEAQQQHSPPRSPKKNIANFEGPPTIGSEPSKKQQRRKGSWAWLYGSSHEEDMMEAKQLSHNNSALTVDAIVCDATLRDWSSVTPVLSTGSESSWESQKPMVTKPVAVCFKVS